MQLIRSQGDIGIEGLLPGLMAMSVLFGTTSMLAVTITFERRSRSFDRLLIAPISISTLVIAKILEQSYLEFSMHLYRLSLQHSL